MIEETIGHFVSPMIFPTAFILKVQIIQEVVPINFFFSQKLLENQMTVFVFTFQY